MRLRYGGRVFQNKLYIIGFHEMRQDWKEQNGTRKTYEQVFFQNKLNIIGLHEMRPIYDRKGGLEGTRGNLEGL